MFRRGSGHGHELPDGFVEPFVGPVPEQEGQMRVLLLILGVTQLVVDGVEVLEAEVLRAHPDSKVLPVTEVPGGGVADHVSVLRLPQHGTVPEGLRDPQESHGRVEVVRGLKHLLYGVVLRRHLVRGVDAGLVRVGHHVLVEVVPEPAPHVAKDAGWKLAGGAHVGLGEQEGNSCEHLISEHL